MLTIWCNNDFAIADQRELALLKSSLSSYRVVMFDETDNSDTSSSALRNADIAFGYPDPDQVVQSETLRWVQLNSAGYTSYDRVAIKNRLISNRVILTNSSSVYDEPCAQHLLAMITSLARQLPAALDSQRSDQGWPMASLRSQSRLLNQQTVLMLGFGAIARRLVELLSPLHMNLVAVRRTVNGSEPIHVAEINQVDNLLPLADHVVNILPANEQTRNFLNAARLSSLKRGAVVYNIGRGVTIDQDALLKELVSGRLAAAYLDVTDPEPLPAHHALWTTPNCFITPHSGGGHSNEKERQVNHFLENLGRFERGEDLINRVL
ncbi:MAG TPA: D-2-hydroxyacid dehydrogenase [Pyrinomonadaceae bacterium]|nr:D-2-hydroxyacid dehydrogenase [Pyrinomonadaceae bacterium]